MDKCFLSFTSACLIAALGSISATAQNFQWADGAGSSDPNDADFGAAVTTDPSGNSYITGKYFETATFGSKPLTSVGGSDIFIVKYDQDGVVQWVSSAGSSFLNSTLEEGSDIVFYDDGGTGLIYVVGKYVAELSSGHADFDGISLPGADDTGTQIADIFIAQYDADLGQPNWVTRVVASAEVQAHGVTVDPENGQVFVAGSILPNGAIPGEIYNEDGSLADNLPSAPSVDVLVVSFDINGDWFGWAMMNGNGDDQARDVAFYQDPGDGQKYLYLTGHFNSDLDFEGSTSVLNSSGNEDVFVAKIDATFATLGIWAAKAGGGASEIGQGITVDSNSEVYITGTTGGSMSFFGAGAASPGFTMTTSGTGDIFIAKYDASGSPIWSNSAGGSGSDGGSAIVLDSRDESPWITGYGAGDISFGNDPEGGSVSVTPDNPGSENIVLAHYDLSTGLILEAFVEGGDMNERGLGLATNQFRDIFITGYYNGTAQFGEAFTPASAGGQDIFLAKLIPYSFQNAFAGMPSVDIGDAQWTDLDDDGELDAIIAGSGPTVEFWRNNGDGTGAVVGVSVTVLLNSSLSMADFNGDGFVDYAIIGTDNVTRNSIVYRNDGAFSFTDVSDNQDGALGVSDGDVDWIDYDNDGDLDLFISGENASLTPTTEILRNDGSDIFIPIGTSLPGFDFSDADWGDFDNDEDKDLLITGFDGNINVNATRIYRNDGSGSFTAIVDLAALDLGSVSWVDYDNDGDLDAFVTGDAGGVAFVSDIYRNDGADNFLSTTPSIDGFVDGDASWGDYDNDGDQDLLIAGNNGTDILTVIYNNEGSGVFSEIDQGFIGLENSSVAWGNYDNDGDLDVLITGRDDQGDVNTVLYSSLEDVNGFNLPPNIDGLIISASADPVGNTVTFNWDGDMTTDDFTVWPGFTYNLRVGTTPGGSDIMAPNSDPATGFRRIVARGNVDHNESWTLTPPDGDYFYSLQAIDGAFAGSAFKAEQPFTIGASGSTIPVITNIEPISAISGSEVTIFGANFETTPANNSVTLAGTSAVVTSATSNQLVVTVPSASVGPGDVTVSNANGTSLAFDFTIVASPSPGAFGDENVITTLTNFTFSTFAADLDEDGDMDVLSASTNDDKIAWYENTDGLGNFGAQQVITTSTDGPFSVFASDLDGDGDQDVLSASIGDDKIAWYENSDGLGNFGAQQVISTMADGAYAVFAADLDLDGDLDVISASQSDNKVAWYENTDGLGTFGSQQVISTLAIIPSSVFAADLDADGDIDVLSSSIGDDKIAWYENTDGLGNFGSQQVITTLADVAYAVFATDLDGDGDMDVLSASEEDDKIAWYRNTDGLGTFGAQQVIVLADGARSVFAADMDGDGDADVLSASTFDDKIAWYENADGLGSFGAQQVISSTANGAGDVYVADLDGDGDLDVLSADAVGNQIAWYENAGAQSICSGTTTLTANSGSFSDGSDTQNYLPDTNCSWLIQPANGGTITLTFISFDTELDSDFLEVYDGADATATQLFSQSGSSIPSPVTSSGASLFVQFTSDDGVEAAGWDASYSTQTTSGATIYTVSPDDNKLRTIDGFDQSTTSAVDITLSGETVNQVLGLAKHPTTGELYAVAKVASSSTQFELVTIDPSTGSATSIGNTGDKFAGLTFDDSGKLYGVTGDGAAVPASLYQIDIADGSTTLVATLGNGDDGESIAFNTDDGMIYHISGNAIPIFEKIDPANEFAITDIGLDQDPNGSLALAYVSGFFLGAGLTQVYSVNQQGSLTFLGTPDHKVKGIALEIDQPNLFCSGTVTLTDSATVRP